MRKTSSRTAYIFIVFLLALFPLLSPQNVDAAPMTSKAVTIGNSAPSANTTHQFSFTITSVSNVGSIEFEYCSNSPLIGVSCTAPSGFSASSAILIAQTGESGFSISPDAPNRLLLTRPSASTSAIPVSYSFANVINPSTVNETTYVRISTYATDDATGSRTDEGAVAFATVPGIAVAGYVPPYLIFCTGVTVELNCSNTTGSYLNFGELVSTQPRYLSSQFAVATNDPGGYSTTVSGLTMTSGNNFVPALGAPSSSQPGTSQFGMNLRANSNPPVGANPSGVGTGAISAGYNSPNQFYFKNQVLTESTISSDFNAFTVSYLINVSGSQSPGIYSTTLTYIAVAAF